MQFQHNGALFLLLKHIWLVVPDSVSFGAAVWLGVTGFGLQPAISNQSRMSQLGSVIHCDVVDVWTIHTDFALSVLMRDCLQPDSAGTVAVLVL